MSVETFLCWLVVVRRNCQHAVDAKRTRSLRTLDRDRCRITARSGDHFGTPASEFDSGADNKPVLLVRHRHALAGCAAGNKHANTACDLIFDQVAQTFLVNRTVSPERSDQSCCASAEPVEL